MPTELRPPAPIRPVWLLWAEHQMALGIREARADADNPRIIEYLTYCSRPGIGRWFFRDETPWCSAFVNAAMIESGYAATGSPAARSWLRWGVCCAPKVGAIAVFRRGINPLQGHVGIVTAVTRTTLQVIGGNQRNRVCVLPYPRARLLDCRWPNMDRVLP